MVSVKWCQGHNDHHTQEGARKAPPSVRDFSHLMCAGGWDAIKLQEKEIQLSSHTLTLWVLRPIEQFGWVVLFSYVRLEYWKPQQGWSVT